MSDEELEDLLGPVYNRQGERITIAEYLRLREDPSYRTVAIDREGSLRVSTIWTGTDLCSAVGGPPVFLETMGFDDEARTIVYDARRYSHEDHAIDGHRAACLEVLGREPAGRALIAALQAHLAAVEDVS